MAQSHAGVLKDARHHASGPEVTGLLARVLRQALSITNSDCGVVLLLDEERGDLRVETAAIRGNLAAEPPPRLERRATPRGLVFRTLDSRQPVRVADVSKESDHLVMFQDIRSHLSVPILLQERVLGVVVVESPQLDAYGALHVRVLQDLARQVAIPLRRAQLYGARLVPGAAPGRGMMIRGLSPAWAEAERRMERAADTHATVLLRGESGTGKELAAHAIHFMSQRARARFVVVNCGAIPEGLLESELFGHVRGAFTGAVSDRAGRFEEADGGTLFLDEVAELSPALQVKLLRVLESGEVTKVGAPGPARRVEVRVVAATNRPLEKMIREGGFREDLYYRLNVVSIRLPPLREYKESIPTMARSMLAEFARAYGRTVQDIHPSALSALTAYDYPGNVRELRNIIEQAVVLETAEVLRLESLPQEVRGAGGGGSPEPQAYRHALRRFERQYLVELLGRCQGDVTRAAEEAGLHRVHIYRMIRRAALVLDDFRPLSTRARRSSTPPRPHHSGAVVASPCGSNVDGPAPAPGEGTTVEHKTRVLLVDDDEDIRFFLGIELKDSGFDVVEAVDGQDALEKLPLTSPDVVLLDLMMPRLGGAAFLERLARQAGGSVPPVVLHSAFTEPTTTGHANVTEVLRKPATASDIIAAVKRSITQPPSARVR